MLKRLAWLDRALSRRLARASVLIEVDESEDEDEEDEELPEDDEEEVEAPEDLRPLRTPLAQREMAWSTMAVNAPRGPAMKPDDEDEDDPDDELEREVASEEGRPPPR
jgi:hypothetical protein